MSFRWEWWALKTYCPPIIDFFYIPDLKAQSKTIIAVTHDDNYFNTADRVLKMEYGKLVDYDNSFASA